MKCESPRLLQEARIFQFSDCWLGMCFALRMWQNNNYIKIRLLTKEIVKKEVLFEDES